MHVPCFRPLARLAVAAWIVVFGLGGCSSIISSVTGGFAENLSRAVMDQNDLETARQGLPAFMLIVDGMVASEPEDDTMLLAGARIYSSYASAFVSEQARSKRLAEKAWDYARRAWCARLEDYCDLHTRPFEEYAAAIAQIDEDDIDVLFGYGLAWAGLIEASQGDWDRLAEVPKVEAIMTRVAELDPSYENGMPYVYLGVFKMVLPPSLGGKPKEARAYFERALELSSRRNYMIQVIYAQFYARAVFDKELHNRLIDEVLSANPAQPGLTLMNTLAQERAKALKADADDYF